MEEPGVEEAGVEEAEALCAPTRSTAERAAEALARWSSSSLSQSVVYG